MKTDHKLRADLDEQSFSVNSPMIELKYLKINAVTFSYLSVDIDANCSFEINNFRADEASQAHRHQLIVSIVCWKGDFSNFVYTVKALI